VVEGSFMGPGRKNRRGKKRNGNVSKINDGRIRRNRKKRWDEGRGRQKWDSK